MAYDTAAASPLLRRFVAGLARQVPRDKLRSTLAPPSSSSSSSSHSNDALRLFLERATAALPMGSRARTAVGKDFDGALVLLREELERRVARELRDVDSGVADGSVDDDVMAAGKQLQEGRQYPILAFSREQHEKTWEAALRNNDKAALTLLRCSDHAAPADLVKDIEASSDATAALGSIRNALLLRDNNKDASLDYRAIISKFVKLLSSEDDETSALSSIRTLLSCLATLDALPVEAAGAVGTLAGCYAGLSNEDGGFAAPGTSDSVTHVVSVALVSFPTDHNGRAPVAVAKFVRGYLRGMSQISTSRDKAGGSSKRQRNAISAGALASLAAALGAKDSLRGCLPVLPKTKKPSTPAEERKVVKAQLNTWHSWADNILGAEGQDAEEEGADEIEAGKEPEDGDSAEGKGTAGPRGGKKGQLPALPEESALNDAELEGNATIDPPPRGRGRPKKRKGSDDASERSVPGAKQRKDSDAGESVASATPTRRSARVRAHSESSRGSLA